MLENFFIVFESFFCAFVNVIQVMIFFFFATYRVQRVPIQCFLCRWNRQGEPIESKR